jgi:hypothetical protein
MECRLFKFYVVSQPGVTFAVDVRMSSAFDVVIMLTRTRGARVIQQATAPTAAVRETDRPKSKPNPQAANHRARECLKLDAT